MRIEKKLIISIGMLIAQQIAFGQGEEESQWYKKGEVYGNIFANVHTEFVDTHAKGFDLDRAYIGYKSNVNDKLSGNIKLDLGSAKDVAGDAAKKRFAYIKNAYIQYKYQKFTFKLGIADCFQFKVQESFWGYRYVFNSFQDRYKFGASADIGFFTTYKASDIISLDFSVANGEGYSSIQEDEDFRTAFGITINPVDIVTIRLYSDYYSAMDTTKDEPQYTGAAFAGIKTDIFSLGVEWNYQANSGFLYNQSKYGTSVYSTVNITEKIKTFARYDYVASNKLHYDADPWNFNKDGSNIIVGCQYHPFKNLKVAANYRTWLNANDDNTNTNAFYINFDLSF